MTLAPVFFRRFAFSVLVALLAVPSQAAAESRASSPERPLKIALVGDSTMSDYRADDPTRGWGQLLPQFLTPRTEVINVARGGASTKTFPADRWERVLREKPDFVLIQFGHNDSHAKDKPESTDAATDFRENLRRYLREARDAAITPVLVTPVRRRMFRSNGNLSEELRPYADAVRAVAVETGTTVIDLHALSGELYQRLGEEGSTSFTLNNQKNPEATGRGDRTHFTEDGARRIAELIVSELPRVDPRLAAVVRR